MILYNKKQLITPSQPTLRCKAKRRGSKLQRKQGQQRKSLSPQNKIFLQTLGFKIKPTAAKQ